MIIENNGIDSAENVMYRSESNRFDVQIGSARSRDRIGIGSGSDRDRPIWLESVATLLSLQRAEIVAAE